jgi:hypothetical protein
MGILKKVPFGYVLYEQFFPTQYSKIDPIQASVQHTTGNIIIYSTC